MDGMPDARVAGRVMMRKWREEEGEKVEGERKRETATFNREKKGNEIRERRWQLGMR
jgi:hypothetical protein